ncbi:MAG TPA: class I SAM-dependent methyltransferase, partial [Ignavibacteria bacterium]
DNAGKILDQGCGTGEYSLLFGERYTGLDFNKDYIEHARKKYPGIFIHGSAVSMDSLIDNSFDVVYSVGLYHHLQNDEAKKAIEETLRVTKKGGRILIIDAMLPKNPLNIIGFILRKMDRGGNVRKVEDTLKLLPSDIKFKKEIISSYPFDFVTIMIDKE